MSPKYMAPGTPEQIEAETQQRAELRRIERMKWAELQRVYERCKAIAEQTWWATLTNAETEQQQLAERMRDRMVSAFHTETEMIQPGTKILAREIPVPLLTPRDRLQFIKEATVALFIEAGKRNLTAMPEPKEEVAPLTEAPEEAIVGP